MLISRRKDLDKEVTHQYGVAKPSREEHFGTTRTPSQNIIPFTTN